MPKPLKVTVPVDITLDDIVDSVIWDGSYDDIFEIIVALDEGVASVEFTERLRDYFVEEMFEVEMLEEESEI